jgi:hypothetical protein
MATTKVEITNKGTTNVDVDSTVDVRGLDNINQSLTLALPQPLRMSNQNELILPQPFRTENRQELAVTQPVVTEGRNELSLDIRPLTVDLCLNVKMAAPAPTCIRQPYQHHFGFTLFGIELFGLNFSGEAQTIVQDLPKQPHVAWGGPPPAQHSHCGASWHHGGHAAGTAAESAEPRSGLRVRLGP